MTGRRKASANKRQPGEHAAGPKARPARGRVGTVPALESASDPLSASHPDTATAGGRGSFCPCGGGCPRCAGARHPVAASLPGGRDALAVTHQGRIHLAPGAHALPAPQLALVLAHERVHVAQQHATSGRVGTVVELEDEARRLAPVALAGRSPGFVLRAPLSSHLYFETDPAAEPETIPISDDRQDQRSVIDLVNQRLHERFGVATAGADRLTRHRVHFGPADRLGRSLRRSDLESLLFRLFTRGQRPLIVWNILSRAGVSASDDDAIRRIIRRGIRAGYFEYQQDQQSNLGTFWRGGVHRITPVELAFRHTAGFTRSARRQGARRVFMPLPGTVDTLIHEACHFYTSRAFQAFTENRAGRYVMTLSLEHVLREGFTEYFTRELVRSYPADFGASEDAYPQEWEASLFLIATMGEDRAADAYFRGDPAALQRLDAVIALYEGRARPTISFPESAVHMAPVP